MNENYYVGYQAFKDGMGLSHAVNTMTDFYDFCFDAWFAGYNQAAFDERWNRLHKKSERWWRGL